MAMIECTECKQQRSEFAAICPHCGCQHKPLRVSAVDVDIGFANLVGLFVKGAFALLPAVIIIVAVGAFVASFIGGMASK